MRTLLPLLLALLGCWGAPRAGEEPDLSREKPASFDDCDRLVLRYPDALESYNCYSQVAARLNDRPGAARRLEARLSAEPDNHAARLYLGLIKSGLGELEAAEDLYRTAARGFERRGHGKGEGYARISLAMLLLYVNRPAEALAELDRVEAVAAEAGDDELLGMAVGQRAVHATTEQDYASAWKHYKRLESLAFPDGSQRLQSWALSGLGLVSWATKRYRQGLEYYRREAELYRSVGNRYGEAAVRDNIATLLYELGKDSGLPEGEIEQASLDSLQAAVETGNGPVEANARFRLAQIQQGPRGMEHARKGLEIARRLNRRRELTEGLLTTALCSLTLAPPEVERALEYVEEALALARDHADLQAIAQALGTHGRVLAVAGRREEALAVLLEGLDAVEKLRLRQTENEVRARYFSRWRGQYATAIGVILGPDPGSVTEDDVDLAFRISERLRARTLLDQLTAAGAAPMEGRSDESGVLRQRQTVAVREIAGVQKRLLYEDLRREERDSLLGRLQELEREEFTVRTRLADEDPGYALLHRPEIPAIGDVRAGLGPDQALLSFCHGPAGGGLLPSRSWVFVVTAADGWAYPIPGRRELEDLVGAYLALLRRRDDLEPRAGSRLYDELLRDALDALPRGITRLVVVPDGMLARLPFAALRSGARSEPLGNRYEITTAPSAATWLRLRRAPHRTAPRSVLALADPPTASRPAAGGDRRRAAWTEGLALPAIPGTRREAQAVIRELGGEASLLSGREATETALKGSDLHDYAVLLLATHTVIDDEHPDRTAVVLSPGGDDQDGLLQAREIADLDFGGRVVVMSGCSSAGGEHLEGEGILGLARSFFVAGARTVVGSLWPLEDREAAELVGGFADHLGRGLSVSAAMAAAQRELQRDGAPPAAWAGMVVLGDGEHTPFPRRTGRRTGLPRWWLAVGGVLLVAAIVLRRVLR